MLLRKEKTSLKEAKRNQKREKTCKRKAGVEASNESKPLGVAPQETSGSLSGRDQGCVTPPSPRKISIQILDAKTPTAESKEKEEGGQGGEKAVSGNKGGGGQRWYSWVTFEFH